MTDGVYPYKDNSDKNSEENPTSPDVGIQSIEKIGRHDSRNGHSLYNAVE